MTMDAIDALLTRESVSAQALTLPAPDAQELERAFKAALTAPDHGALKPWRFLVVRGEGLKALGDLYAEGLKHENPAAGPELLDIARGKALRSPLLIVCAAVVRGDHPKVPAVEQVVSAAAATQNLQTALHALGYAAMLVTGPRAYDAVVKQGLGLKAEDAIIGFLHVGTAPADRVWGRIKRPEVARHVQAWPA